MKRIFGIKKTEKSASDPKGQEEEIMSKKLVTAEAVPTAEITAVENNVKISIIDKQVAIFKFGVTTEQIDLAKALDPESTVIRNKEGDVIFSVNVGKESSLSAAGMVLSDKKDFIIHRDKPLTEQEVSKDFGAAIIKTNAVIAKIQAAIAGSAEDLAGSFKEVSI